MRRKINILIAISLTAFVILAIIQYILVRDTYNYKIEAYKRDLKIKDDQISRYFTKVDTLRGIGADKLKDVAISYYDGNIRQESILDSIRALMPQDSIGNLILEEYKKGLSSDKVEIGTILEEYIVFDTITNRLDTVFSSAEHINNQLWGNLSNLSDAIKINVGTSTSDFGPEYAKVTIRVSNFLSIKNWKRDVLLGMWGLLSLALLVLLGVVLIFAYTLRSWIKQRRINDVTKDFINNITHEFKTPLASLSVASKTLRKDIVQQNKDLFESTLASVDRQNTRLQNLLDQVLSKSLGSEDLELKKIEIEVQKFLTNVVQDFKYTIEESLADITLNMRCAGQIFIDPVYMTSAIFNILENAVKYGGEKVAIEISCSKKESDFILEIKNNGPRIVKNRQEQIFDKFYRVNEGDLHNVKGLGLGLYYVKNIVDAHDGLIDLSSDALSTCFKINLKGAYVQ